MYVYIYIYIYLYIVYLSMFYLSIYLYIYTKPNLMYVAAMSIKKSHIFFIQIYFRTVFFHQCMCV